MRIHRLVHARLLAAAFSLAALAGPAAAERPPAARDATAAATPEVVYQARTRYDFDDDIVEGDLVQPDGAMVHVGKRHGFESLIHIRQDFLPEMLKAADDL